MKSKLVQYSLALLTFCHLILSSNCFSVVEEDIEVILLCRDIDKFVFKIYRSKNSSERLSVQVNSSSEIIFNQLITTIPNITQIENLDSNSSYTLSLWKENADLLKSLSISTLADQCNLEPVSHANITAIEVDGDTLSTYLEWEPGTENVCSYEVVIWPVDSIETRILSPSLEDLYRLKLEELTYSSKYAIAIYPITECSEGVRAWVNFTTPSCNEQNSYNYTICLPDEPKDVQFEYGNCEVTITWLLPPITPEKYILSVFPDNPKIEAFNLTYRGNESKAVLNTKEFGANYVLFIKAQAELGFSRSVFYEKNICEIDEPESIQKRIYITIASLVLIFTCAISIIILIRLKKKHVPSINIVREYKEIESTQDVKTSPYDDEDSEYEIKRDKIKELEILGEGEFGIVCRALLTTDKETTTEVAIKKLRAITTPEDLKQLKEEIKVHKNVGTHKNIVSMIGYCKTELLLVVEYCSLGDLQNYLRNVWKAKIWMTNLSEEMDSEGLLKNGVCNFLYDKSDVEKKQITLTSADLLSFARQICLGMEYLSKNRVVHRDLAARNVLLTNNLTAKISDFGLSRDIYEENMYRKKTSAKLPIKWMAIESLVHHVFTTQSDVWSFGVLLWEIMTLGNCPYPSLLSGQVCELLLKGYRMEKPAACSQKLYGLMLSCWDALPHKRPSFSTLVEKLDVLLEAESPNKYVELDTKSDYSEMYETSTSI